MTESSRSSLNTISKLCGRLLGPFQRSRAERESKSWRKALDETRAATGENRMRVQVCPRGCSQQLARRDVVTRTQFSGKADINIMYKFETLSCGKCGTPYQRGCVRCDFPIFAPVMDRCEWCGLPHPWAVERRSASTRSQPREWRDDETTKAPAELLARYGDDKELFVIEGDITTFAIDAVISNDDADGRMWTLVASSIRSAAGTDVELESVSHGPYPLGSAWFTHGGNLPTSRGIIHVAAMDRNGKSNGLETVQKCVWSALELAVDEEIESVALAAIGTAPPVIEEGIESMTHSAISTPSRVIKLDDWLKGIASEVVKFLHATSNKLAVLLVLYGQDDFAGRVELLRNEVASAMELSLSFGQCAEPSDLPMSAVKSNED